MLGAIIGDIAGSRFEFNNWKSKDFILFAKNCFVTDDSIMTLAAAMAIMNAAKNTGTAPYGNYPDTFYERLEQSAVRYMQGMGQLYPHSGYGGMFRKWLKSDNPKPYNSFGNGAAMRISPAGFAAKNEKEARRLSKTITAITHNHPEGIKGAEATVMAIFLAKQGQSINEIREYISKHYYPLDFTIDEIRPTYQFNETCQETVPQAIEAFLESNSFEDALKTGISLGGDSDTIGAITGAIAQAYYGIPDDIREQALAFLDDDMKSVLAEWEEFINTK